MNTKQKATVIAGLIENKPLREIGKEVGKHYTTIHKLSEKEEIKKIVEEGHKRLIKSTVDKIVDIDVKLMKEYHNNVLEGKVNIQELDTYHSGYAILEKIKERIGQSVRIYPSHAERSSPFIQQIIIDNQNIRSSPRVQEVLSNYMTSEVIDIEVIKDKSDFGNDKK